MSGRPTPAGWGARAFGGRWSLVAGGALCLLLGVPALPAPRRIGRAPAAPDVAASAHTSSPY
ncbi:hypothetical protein [Streptomyces sp. 8L]|uniref:hypothetical protein n=1 Tax=Streptomyces sp. 8L TaxID=2877242 RepID=UPI001CD47B71|nr:hypothetical protein [Streptomyces sp. 8L]MCA1218771.1 hypothetical protein [Streptomyces sp. 8L]